MKRPVLFRAESLNIGSVVRFQGIHELGWEINCNFVFTCLKLTFSFSFNNGCSEHSNFVAARLQKCVKFNISHYLKLLQHQKGKPEYIYLRTKMSLFKKEI